jgi:hypothetical protein
VVTDYWIFKVQTQEGGLWRRSGFDLFVHRIKEGFWGIREYNEKGRLSAKVGDLKKGDFVVFYLVSSGGRRFIGTCVLDSGFERLDPERAKLIVHREYLDCETGVFVKNVDKWAKPLPMECLRGKDSFVAAGGKFGSHFKGSIKKIKNKEEYDIIIQEHELLG